MADRNGQPSQQPSFAQRMFTESEKVYADIVNPNTPPVDVEARLFDAQLKASEGNG